MSYPGLLYSMTKDNTPNMSLDLKLRIIEK